MARHPASTPTHVSRCASSRHRRRHRLGIDLRFHLLAQPGGCEASTRRSSNARERTLSVLKPDASQRGRRAKTSGEKAEGQA